MLVRKMYYLETMKKVGSDELILFVRNEDEDGEIINDTYISETGEKLNLSMKDVTKITDELGQDVFGRDKEVDNLLIDAGPDMSFKKYLDITEGQKKENVRKLARNFVDGVRNNNQESYRRIDKYVDFKTFWNEVARVSDGAYRKLILGQYEIPEEMRMKEPCRIYKIGNRLFEINSTFNQVFPTDDLFKLVDDLRNQKV
jgi:hypothetical protein